MLYPLTILLLLCIFSSRAQKKGQPLVDSLVSALSGKKEDTAKVKLFVTLARLYTSIEPRKGFKFADSGLTLARKLQWQPGIAETENCFGLLTGDTGNNASARGWFEKRLAINKAIDAKASMIACMSNIGRSYEREANFAKASEYYFQALALAENSGNDEQAALLGTNITSLYYLQGDYKKAAFYAAETIKKGEAA